jgi:hypothetical protein
MHERAWVSSLFVLITACGSDSHNDLHDPQPVRTDAGQEAGKDAGPDVEEDDEEFPLDWVLHQSCEPSDLEDTCKRCEAEKCCEAAEATQTPAVRDIARCWVDCTQPGGSVADCWELCDSEHPGGIEPFATYFVCTQQQCSAEEYGCNDEPKSGCERCMNDNCGSEYVGLLGSRVGFLWFWCNGACRSNDGTCYDQCVETYSEALPLLERMGECMASECPNCPGQL